MGKLAGHHRTFTVVLPKFYLPPRSRGPQVIIRLMLVDDACENSGCERLNMEKCNFTPTAVGSNPCKTCAISQPRPPVVRDSTLDHLFTLQV